MTHSALYTKTFSSTTTAPFLARLRHRIYDPLSRLFFLMTTARVPLFISKRKYKYFVDWYNYTWTNERAVEIPYFSKIVRRYSSKKILEVGNTLGHYQVVSHTVVDKYETIPGALNIDILNFAPKKKFDLIIAISTVEHIGWHEKEKRASKALEAIEHLQTLLSRTGKLVFSFPIGVNPALDKALKHNRLPQAKLIFLRRKNRWNLWEETSYDQVNSVRYNYPFPNANAICIVEIRSLK